MYSISIYIIKSYIYMVFKNILRSLSPAGPNSSPQRQPLLLFLILVFLWLFLCL